MEEGAQPKSRWYQTWWGTTLAGFGGLVAAFIIVVAATTVSYWWQISHGDSKTLQERFGAGFTASTQGSGAAKIDRAKLETLDDPFLGRPGAPIVIVEFVDFKCPNCKAAAPIIHQVADNYGSKVKIIVRDFPAESLHPGTTFFSQLAYCAGQQKHFWQMHDVFYNDQDTLPEALAPEDIKALADRAGVDAAALSSCANSAEAVRKVKNNYFAGISFGVRGTPTFFINGEKVEGVISFEEWKRYLDNVSATGGK